MLAGVISNPEHVNNSHRSGINVVYSDSSAAWVERKVFNARLSTIPATGFDSSYNNTILRDDETSGIWVDLDRQ